MSLFKQALTDENGQGDIAYLAIAGLTIAAIGALGFIFMMSAISYARCVPTRIACDFDPLPVGQSAGLIFGAFGALIGALAGYMAATRKQRPQQGDQTVIANRVEQVLQPQPTP